MRLINWNEATAEDLYGFTTDYIRYELLHRNLETAGSKDKMIERLLADITDNHLASSTQVMSDLLQLLLTLAQRSTVPVQVTTLPDLSVSLPTFSVDGRISPRQWIKELVRTQGLASWTRSTLLAVALSKLCGPAADWKSVAENHCDTWKKLPRLPLKNNLVTNLCSCSGST